MRIKINYNLQCEVDERKIDCNKDPAHCHITKHGVRVAKVWLSPVIIEGGHSLNLNEISEVISVVTQNKEELKREYENNKINGAD